MPVTADQLAAVQRLLDGAGLWGAELETRYRVLATTFEPTEEAHPDGRGAADRRLQVLFFPVHTILGVLRRRDDQVGLVIERFDVSRLVDVVDVFDGATVHAPLFDLGEPRPGEWKPPGADWSVEGRATTADGRAHDVRFSLRSADDRELDLYATFDDIRVRTPSGEEWDLARLDRLG